MKLNSQTQGKQFEAIFMKLCKMCGYLARKMPIGARYVGPGKLMAVKGELDFQLIHPDHGIAFLDTKTFMGDSFSFSQLSEHQVDLACLLNRWECRAGFIVWFRGPNIVSFFSGECIVSRGPQNSFKPEHGLIVGNVPNMDISKIFKPKASK